MCMYEYVYECVCMSMYMNVRMCMYIHWNGKSQKGEELAIELISMVCPRKCNFIYVCM